MTCVEVKFTDIRTSGTDAATVHALAPAPVLTGEFVARVYKVWDRSEVTDWSCTAPASLSLAIPNREC